MLHADRYISTYSAIVMKDSNDFRVMELVDVMLGTISIWIGYFVLVINIPRPHLSQILFYLFIIDMFYVPF